MCEFNPDNPDFRAALTLKSPGAGTTQVVHERKNMLGALMDVVKTYSLASMTHSLYDVGGIDTIRDSPGDCFPGTTTQGVSV